MSDDADEEETVRVVAEVPKTAKEGAKEKLEYGGITRVVREELERIAYGGDHGRRERLERRRKDLRDERRRKRAEKRELEAEISTLNEKLDSIEDDLQDLSTQADRFEGKLESIETQLRGEGIRMSPNHPMVQDAAATGGVGAEEVVETLMERNPDVPEYAFTEALHDTRVWQGLPDDAASLPVDERDSN